MMAKIRSFWIVGCLFLFSFGKTHAQVALNFTMTDTKGKEWNLYEELLKGKTVVLDFFFADCTPCQRLTPAMALLYDSLSKDSVLVLGISDRDLDIRLDKFETDFGVTYPSCGVQGGGDTITDMYKGFFNFPSWPLYAVICPNGKIDWNVQRDTSHSKVYEGIIECKKSLDLQNDINKIATNLYPNPVQQDLHLDFMEVGNHEIMIYSMDGKLLLDNVLNANEISIDLSSLENGIYLVNIRGTTENGTWKIEKE